MASTQGFWLPRLTRTCLEHSLVPLTGGLPPCPWESLRKELRELLQLPSLEITSEAPNWIESPPLFEETHHWNFSCEPLQGTVTLVIHSAVLMQLFATSCGQPTEALMADASMGEGFSLFVLLSLLQKFSSLSYPPGTQLSLVSKAEGHPLLEIEILLSTDTQRWPCTLYVSDLFLNSLQSHFAPQPLEKLNPSLAAQIDVTCDFTVGETLLPLASFRELALGDFLCIDQFTLDPATGDGSVTLRIGTQAVWGCVLSEGQLTAQNPFPAHLEDGSMSIPTDDDSDVLNELDQMNSFDEEDLEAAQEAPGAPKKTRTKKKATFGNTALEKAEVRLVISLGRISMSLRDLLSLQEGNLLDLPITLQGPVDLLVGEQRVGRGELIQIDETLGVRITEI